MSAPAPLNWTATVVEKRRRSIGRTIAGAIAATWLALVILGAIFAPVIVPDGEYTQDLTAILTGPTPQHWLGTDTLGRDVLARLMYGARPTLVSVSMAIVVHVVVGVVGGLIAGFFGGWRDRIISSGTNIVIALPGIIVLFVVLSIYRGNIFVGMLVYGFLTSPSVILLVRSSALSVRHELFVDAAKVSGLSSIRIIFTHVMPRIYGLLLAQVSVFAAHAIVIESSLSFLGFGVQVPAPSWGNMITEAASRISLNPWMLYPTGLTIAATALAVGVYSEILRASASRGWSESKLSRDPERVSAAEERTRKEIPAPTSLLSVRGLSIGYDSPDGVHSIVKDVSFDVGRGETLGLVGESGSGKTTVAFGVLGLLGESLVATNGSVIFDGVDLMRLPRKKIAAFRGKRVAYVAQEPMVALDPNYRVGRQLLEAISHNDDVKGDAARERMHELLRLVELKDPQAIARRYPHELSGGMAQRVSIAFALAGRPELLIADEPTTALDVTVQAGILGLLIRLRELTGMSMLIITHDWGVLADVCDHVAVMYRGEIVEHSDVESIFERPTHPYTRALLASNPHGAEPGVDLPVISGVFETPLTPKPVPDVVEAELLTETQERL